MKKIILAALTAVILFSCGEKPNENTEAKADKKISFYGSKFDPKGAITPAELAAKMKDGGEQNIILKTKINQTCSKKGCWMSVEMPDNEEMMISMIDYSFFVPKSGAEGLETYIKGKVAQDTVSVEHLRHLAEDANKSKEEIDAISEPKIGLSMVATGIAIVGYHADDDAHRNHENDEDEEMEHKEHNH